MSREQIERRLQMHVLNVSLAASAGKDGDLRQCIKLLVDEVERIVADANKPL